MIEMGREWDAGYHQGWRDAEMGYSQPVGTVLYALREIWGLDAHRMAMWREGYREGQEGLRKTNAGSGITCREMAP